MATIKLISWNVKRILNKTKRYKIITHLKSLDSHVAMLQETHLKDVESVNLTKTWAGQVLGPLNSKTTIFETFPKHC